MATEKVASLDLADSIRDEIVRWLTQPAYASERSALERTVEAAASGDPAALAELEDAFAGPLPIGTGGRRGPCGPGTNRINEALMRETAYGLALAMEANEDAKKVAVVYDTRKTSRQYGALVSKQLAAARLEVLLVDAPRPTPQLSYLVRHHGCGAGIVISASHNPAGDNGIKIYGPDGAQVLGKRDHELMEAIVRVGADPGTIPPLDAPGPGQVANLDVAASDAAYHRHVLDQGVSGSLAEAKLSVVYTPLHGVGHTAIVPVLEARGVEVLVVQSQLPDGGAFGTVASANPENPEALALAEALALETKADLVIASDPDADRLGALVRHDAKMHFVDGNRLGVLMLDHVLSELDSVPSNGIVLTTMVTSPLIATLCREAEVEVVDDLLVGFKHHAGVMRETEGRPLVFACEESHGYNRGNDVRDKDGAVAALLLAECAAVDKQRERTSLDRLREIWDRHGYHREKTVSLWAHGSKGKAAIARVMQVWRQTPPESVGGLSLAESVDRAEVRATGSQTRDLPGNVLGFELEGSDLACRLVVRPSGTEPKLKLYVMARGSRAAGAAASQAVDALIGRVIADAEARAHEIMAPVLES